MRSRNPNRLVWSAEKLWKTYGKRASGPQRVPSRPTEPRRRLSTLFLPRGCLDDGTTSNGIEPAPCDPRLAAQLEVAERVMHDDRDVQRLLADSQDP